MLLHASPLLNWSFSRYHFEYQPPVRSCHTRICMNLLKAYWLLNAAVYLSPNCLILPSRFEYQLPIATLDINRQYDSAVCMSHWKPLDRCRCMDLTTASIACVSAPSYLPRVALQNPRTIQFMHFRIRCISSLLSTDYTEMIYDTTTLIISKLKKRKICSCTRFGLFREVKRVSGAF
jgi:hypothetical protein